MSRKIEREIIILSLYSLEFTEQDILETIHFIASEKKSEQSVSEFVIENVKGVIEHKEEIDAIIARNLEKYTIDRLSYIDLQIFRFAVYELLYHKETAPAVVINEAVELTKMYSDLDDQKASKFNNSVLDKIKKDLNL